MANNMNQQPGNQLEIELTEQEASGTYSNLVMISHSPSEFVMDFICVMPGLPKAKVIKRLIVTPDHAKRLVKALQDNINRYEASFGMIDAHDRTDFPMQFRGPMPEA
jgi:hypothetical protein